MVSFLFKGLDIHEEKIIEMSRILFCDLDSLKPCSKRVQQWIIVSYAKDIIIKIKLQQNTG